MTDLVLWTERTAPGTAHAAAGAKMGRLAELARAGVNVPRSYTVTADAYRRQCAESGLGELIDGLHAAGIDAGDETAVAAASRQLQEAFAATAVVEPVRAAVADAYEELCERCLEINVPVAVRSSAAGEDSSDASFAGAFDTYLGIAGVDRVIAGVQRCWGSLFTPRALAYRLRRGIDHRSMPMAVGVVELVHARASGVAFSIHPVTGRRDRMVVEASWGWGEAVVQGLVTPDHVEVGKADRRILRYDVATKDVVSAFDFAAGRVAELPMPERLRTRAVLDSEQIGQIVDAVLRVEEHYGYPVDVEWVLDRHRRPGEPVSIVQARPVTVVADGPAQSGDPRWDPVAYAFGKGSRTR